MNYFLELNPIIKILYIIIGAISLRFCWIKTTTILIEVKNWYHNYCFKTNAQISMEDFLESEWASWAAFPNQRFIFYIPYARLVKKIKIIDRRNQQEISPETLFQN